MVERQGSPCASGGGPGERSLSSTDRSGVGVCGAWGTTTSRWWGESIGVGNANCNGCGSPWDNRLLADVDSFAPNPFGLYGMLGNAWQWTADCWHPDYRHAPQDGSAWTEQDCRKYTIRGGSWHNLPIFIRSAARSGSEPGDDEYDYSSLTGLRVARDLP